MIPAGPLNEPGGRPRVNPEPCRGLGSFARFALDPTSRPPTCRSGERSGLASIARISGEAFLTEPGLLSKLVTEAAEKVAGVRPTLSTTGGTS